MVFHIVTSNAYSFDRLVQLPKHSGEIRHRHNSKRHAFVNVRRMSNQTTSSRTRSGTADSVMTHDS